MSIIQSLWIGSRLSGQEILSIRSFLANGHEYHLYVYDDIGPVPAGTIIKDARIILDVEHAHRDRFGTYCFLSDKFRYKLLMSRGGWWVDTDIICVKPFNISDDYFFCYMNNNEVANTVIKVPPYSNIIINMDLESSLIDDHLSWGIIGSDLLTRTLRKPQFQPLQRFIHAPDAIFPIPHNKWQYIFFKEFSDIPSLISSETYGIHLSNQMINLNKQNAESNGFNMDRNRIFPENTIFGYYQKLYL